MERLSKRYVDTGNAYTQYFRSFDGKCEGTAIDKLADYEDMEEQGRIVKFPHKDVWEKSGDTVYYIFDGEIAECIHCGAEIDAEGKVVIVIATEDPIFPYREPDPEHDTDPTDWCSKSTYVLAEAYGITLFSDSEQAEQALSEMEEKHGDII